jgi:hypothetical protein
MLEFAGVSKRFGATKALTDVRFEPALPAGSADARRHAMRSRA